MSMPATAMESLDTTNAVPPAADPANVLDRQHFKSRREQIMQARGTMSMPSSPLGRDGVSMWEDVMNGGSPTTGVDQQEQRYNASPNYHNQPYPASFIPQPAAQRDPEAINSHAPGSNFLQSLMSHPFSVLDPPGYQLDSPASAGLTMPIDNHPTPFANSASHPTGSALHPRTPFDHVRVAPSQPLILVRRKRAQVRIACTHCQKACKKCSNVRPCERCVKYGLPDCVDSTRKPRKTGIKRGPYKRRTSKIPIPGAVADRHYDDTEQSHDSAASSQGESSASGQLGSARIPLNHIEQEDLNMSQSTPVPYRIYQPTHHRVMAAPPHGDSAYERDRALNGPTQPDGAISTPGNLQPGGLSQYGIPPPRGATLGTAMSAALDGPRWVHGQRVHLSGSMSRDNHHSEHHNLPQILMPETPRVPFPLSLGANGVEDPFSRAVSPIRQVRFPGHSTWQSHGPVPVYESAFPYDGSGTAGSSSTVSSPAGWNHHAPSSGGSPVPNENVQSSSSNVLGLLPRAGQAKPQGGSLQIDVNRNVYQGPPATGSPYDLVPSSAVRPTQFDGSLAVASSAGGGYPFSAPNSPRPSTEAWPTKTTRSNSFNFDPQPNPSAKEAVPQAHMLAPSDAHTQARSRSLNGQAAGAESAQGGRIVLPN